jgi:hypothetical protein
MASPKHIDDCCTSDECSEGSAHDAQRDFGRRKWSAAEDEELRRLVEKFGTKAWNQVATELKRTGKQVINVLSLPCGEMTYFFSLRHHSHLQTLNHHPKLSAEKDITTT